MADADYTYDDDDRGWRLECTVEATVVPYVPARTNCRNDDAAPAEGGYLEDVKFTVQEFFLTVGGHEYDMSMSLTDTLRESLSKVVQDAYDKDSSMQDELWGKFEG